MSKTKTRAAEVTTFDLGDVEESIESVATVDKTHSAMPELEAWADEQLAPRQNANGYVVWDIETGPRPEEELAAIYHEKTLEEFADGCDKRWKPDTVAAKFEEYKVTAWQQFVEKAALSPLTGRVLLIGCLWPWSDEPFYIDHGDEVSILVDWWDIVEQRVADKVPMIGHNSNGFDLPFVLRRSWCLGISVPPDVQQGRYWNPLFRDTMERWNCGARDYAKLDVLGGFFGVGKKTEGVEGKDFAKLWFGQMPAEKWGTPEQQRAKALEYNGQDLKLTAAVAAKMGMI